MSHRSMMGMGLGLAIMADGGILVMAMIVVGTNDIEEDGYLPDSKDGKRYAYLNKYGEWYCWQCGTEHLVDGGKLWQVALPNEMSPECIICWDAIE